MISKTIGFRGLAYFQTHPSAGDGLKSQENVQEDCQMFNKNNHNEIASESGFILFLLEKDFGRTTTILELIFTKHIFCGLRF